jgi:hypothetical protein
MCSFGISNMNTNVPTKRILIIIQTILKYRNIKQNKIKEIVNITINTLLHIYLNLNNYCYQQEEGLAMSFPSSAILAEIFIQSIEQ